MFQHVLRLNLALEGWRRTAAAHWRTERGAGGVSVITHLRVHTTTRLPVCTPTSNNR